MNHFTRICLTCFALVVFASVAARVSAETFSDQTFSDHDWTPVIHVYDDNSPPSGAQQSGGSIAQQTSGGDPGAYSHSFIFLESGRQISTSGIYIDDTYDPRQQAITSLDYEFSVRHVGAPAGTSTDAFPALLQDGRLFIGDVTGASFSGNSWTDKSWSGLDEEDFVAIDIVYTGQTIRPDFTGFGAPIQFGYSLTNRVVGGGTLLLARGVDNWQVTANLAPMSDVLADGVDDSDLGFWTTGYGRSGDAYLADGDFDQDNDVDGGDFLKWQRQFGLGPLSTSATIVVPEPATQALLVLASFALVSRRIAIAGPSSHRG